MAETIAAHRMIAPGDVVLVGVSGGPDSTALLHALRALRRSLRCRLRACHVHHGLRGREADADARQARALARSLRIPFTEHRVDVRAHARTHGLSIETAARQLRYRVLSDVADRVGATRIATGHNADDQTETVLLNIVRGAGPAGVAGIPPVRGNLIRPLIGVTRAEVERYCHAQGLSYRLDRSNLDTQHTRNRIRLEILPMLRRVQPQVDSALRRLAAILREENEYISEQARQALREIGSQRPGQIGLARGSVGSLPRALQRRVLRAAIAVLKGDELDLPLERIDAIAALAVSGRTGSVVELPDGLVAELTYGELTIKRAAAKPDARAGEWTLPVPGQVSIPELGVEISAARSRARRPPSDPDMALLDAGSVASPLTVRTWRKGDRFTPLGVRGSVKLHDFFINAKVPRAERESVPIVTSGGAILWVAGHRIDDHYKVTGNTTRTIRLQQSRLA